jgi:hypothetical protein
MIEFGGSVKPNGIPPLFSIVLIEYRNVGIFHFHRTPSRSRRTTPQPNTSRLPGGQRGLRSPHYHALLCHRQDRAPVSPKKSTAPEQTPHPPRTRKQLVAARTAKGIQRGGKIFVLLKPTHCREWKVSVPHPVPFDT